MENASDALIMAGSVFLLIIALTVSISSFTNLRVQFDEIITYKDQVQFAKQGDEYLQYIKSKDAHIRTVGIETIISALRRLRKEQYTVYICLKDAINPSESEKNKLFNNVVLENEKMDEINLQGISQVLKFTIAGGKSRYLENDDIISILYDALKEKKFQEYIGVYQYSTADGVSDANKETYKIITFVQESE